MGLGLSMDMSISSAPGAPERDVRYQVIDRASAIHHAHMRDIARAVARAPCVAVLETRRHAYASLARP